MREERRETDRPLFFYHFEDKAEKLTSCFEVCALTAKVEEKRKKLVAEKRKEKKEKV